MENWRQITEFPFYEVSDQGRVRSNFWKRPRILKPSPQLMNKGRYCRFRVNLQKVRGGPCYQFKIATLVLTAFIGPRPEGYQTCHNDGDTSNNSLQNLRWDTPKGNQGDSVRQGTHSRPPIHLGESHPRAKLTKELVLHIKNTPRTFGSDAALAREIGIAQTAICAVRKGLTWRHAS